ncbi:MAG: tetratricopeptide repeat protein [Ignavibacteriaceae bacterium]|nr:tetratricopeptide repeat protein [Ignavibacteriaceae bacterium]
MPAIPEFELKCNEILMKSGLIDSFLQQEGEFLGHGWDELFIRAKKLLKIEDDGVLRGILLKQMFYRRATLHMEEGDYDEAINNFTTLIEFFPEYHTGYEARAECYCEMERYLEAINDFSAAIKLYPEWSPFYIRRADMKKETGYPEWAMADYNRAIKKNPDFAAGYYSRGRLKVDLEDYTGALKDFNKALSLGYKEEYIYEYRAVCKVSFNDFKGALNDLEQALKLDDYNLKARITRAELLKNLDRLDDAYEDYLIITRQAPAFALPFFELAVICYERGNLPEAKKYIARATELEEEEPDYFNLSGLIHMGTEKYGKAVSEFNKALELDPENPDILCNLAEACVRLGHFHKASGILRRVKKLNPDYADYYYVSAQICFAMKNPEMAIRHCSRALEIDPEYGHALYLRGLVKLSAGDWQGGEDDLTAAFYIKYPDADYSAMIKKLIEREKKRVKTLSD